MNYYIIDGNAYIYRAFFAIPPFKTSSGIYTNAVYGFAKMLLKLMKEKEGSRIIVAFDHKKKSFRHELFEAYKAHRAKMPDEMIGQLPYIKKVVELMRLPVMEIEGMEADDSIASLVTCLEKEGHTSYIITGDKDMMQLVSERIFVYDTMKDIIYDREGVKAKMGVWPEQITDLLGLMGDSADNIPGVSGIGPKTAVTLLEKYRDIEDILAHAGDEKGKLGERLHDHAEDARLSKQLATVHRDIDLSHIDMNAADPDINGLGILFKELEFFSLLKEVGIALGTPDSPDRESEQSASDPIIENALPATRTTLAIETTAAWQNAQKTLDKGEDLFVHILPNSTPPQLLLARISEGDMFHIHLTNDELHEHVISYLREALPRKKPLLTTHSKELYHLILSTPSHESLQLPQLSLFS